MKRLLEAAEGRTRIVTLAPERDTNNQVTRFLAAQGICVSAGHCDPSMKQLRASIDAGLSMITHLGNGCPIMMHRHDNIIQRVLRLADMLWIGIIADGVHVPFETLANYLAITGLDRVFVVSDAIVAAGKGPGTYRIGDQTVVVDEELATWALDRSHLMGSATGMPQMAVHLRNEMGLSHEQIEMLLIRNPRAALGL